MLVLLTRLTRMKSSSRPQRVSYWYSSTPLLQSRLLTSHAGISQAIKLIYFWKSKASSLVHFNADVAANFFINSISRRGISWLEKRLFSRDLGVLRSSTCSHSLRLLGKIWNTETIIGSTVPLKKECPDRVLTKMQGKRYNEECITCD